MGWRTVVGWANWIRFCCESVLVMRGSRPKVVSPPSVSSNKYLASPSSPHQQKHFSQASLQPLRPAADSSRTKLPRRLHPYSHALLVHSPLVPCPFSASASYRYRIWVDTDRPFLALSHVLTMRFLNLGGRFRQCTRRGSIVRSGLLVRVASRRAQC